jgi:O-antigen/teichoic acid export membrane protein
MTGRFDFPRAELRRRTVRGAVVTAAFLILIDGLTLLQGLVVTRLLGPRDIGLYGIVSVTVMTVIALKRVGIDEAFVQQERTEAEQEEEFQHAFTLELLLAAAFAVIVCILAPVVAAAYGDERLLGLMLGVSYLPVAFALLAPLWVFFRRMDYRRQRSLQAIQPIVSFAVTVPLAATGFGVWSLVVGPLVGYVAAIAAGIRVSPYRLALRFDSDVARRYLRFSAPIFVALLATLVVQQGQVVAFEAYGGLAAAGYITLAATLTRYVDRADQIVTATIYPAVCAIQGRTRQLEELFAKSNRATLLYVLPFTAAVVLFAPDLVHVVLGDRWEPAVVLLQGLAAAGLVQHLGFNWFSFYRAHGDTVPPAIEAVVGAVAFLALAVPGLVAFGFEGFVAGRVLAAAVALAVRAVYVRRLLPGVRPLTIAGPAVWPVLVAVTAAGGLRLALWGGQRSPAQAIVEAAVFLGVYALVAMRREGELIAELRAGYQGAG